MNHRVYSLICEGICNPTVGGIDHQLKGKNMPIKDAGLRRALRALVYRPHLMLGETTAQCQVCGATRQYGARDWTPPPTGV